MLSGVLNSKTAIQINVRIMRAFVQLRHLVIDHGELKRELGRAAETNRGALRDRFSPCWIIWYPMVSLRVKKIGFIVKKIIISNV